MDVSRSDDEPSIKKQYLFPCYTDFPFHSPSKPPNFHRLFHPPPQPHMSLHLPPIRLARFHPEDSPIQGSTSTMARVPANGRTGVIWPVARQWVLHTASDVGSPPLVARRREEAAFRGRSGVIPGKCIPFFLRMLIFEPLLSTTPNHDANRRL